MSARPIAVGDLVMVVKPPLCPKNQDSAIGHIFCVDEIALSAPDRVCPSCFVRHSFLDNTLLARPAGEAGFALSRLKRIPPLDELEGQRTEEKLKEPA